MEGLADAVDLLAEARAAGLAVRAEGGELVVEGPRRLGALAERVLAAKPAVLAALAGEVEMEVAWRAEAMACQIPATGAIPFLVARPCEPRDGGCPSCGDPMEAEQRYRCRACAEAARLVVAAREAERTARSSIGEPS